MARSNVLSCTYSGTKLLNSYPPLKLRKWKFISHYVSMGVKARLLDQQIELQDKKKMGN